jgi:hypothetical protein
VFEAALAAASTGAAPIPPAQGDLPPRPEGAGQRRGAGNESPIEGGTHQTDTSKSQEGAEAGAERKLQVGVAGALAGKKRKVPEGEPPAWDGSARLQIVGQKMKRIDGPEKVTGRARYCFDVQLPGMLHAVLVRASSPRRQRSTRGSGMRDNRSPRSPP